MIKTLVNQRNMEEEYIPSNTCGYIKVDKMFISDAEKLSKEYLRIKDIIKQEIIQELEINDQICVVFPE